MSDSENSPIPQLQFEIGKGGGGIRKTAVGAGGGGSGGDALCLAREEALRLGAAAIKPEHIFVGLVGWLGGIASDVLNEMGLTVEVVREEIGKLTGAERNPSPRTIEYSPRTQQLFALTWQEDYQLGYSHVGSGHLLLALMKDESGIAIMVLKKFHLDPEVIREKVLQILRG